MKYTYYQVKGLYNLEIGNIEAAETHFKTALDLSKNPLKSNAYQTALQGLIDVYRLKGQARLELAYTNKYYEFKDSIFSLKQSQLIYDYEARYQKAEQDLAIVQLNKANIQNELLLATKDKQLWISLLSALAILIIAMVSLKAYFQKKKAAELLERKNNFIQKSLQANKMLLKEIHHRVKNNLQVVSSLLYLQSRFLKDSSAKGALDTGRARVQAMSILHQKLYKHEDIQKVDIAQYFEELGHNLFNTYKIKDKNIEFRTSLDDIALDVDTVIPMGLIVNEMISNSLKHAFKGKESGFIHLSIKADGKNIHMKVEDNGVGMPFDQLPHDSDSLGVELIRSFADKLEADIRINNNEGCTIELNFETKESTSREVLMYTESVAS